MSRIFISHSSLDNAQAEALRVWLEEAGFTDLFVDFDPERGIAAGERWERALHAAAERCEAVVFLVSAHWLASDWCGREFDLAAKLSKRMFGVMIDATPLDDVPMRFRATWQFTDLHGGEGHRLFRINVPPTGAEAHVSFSKAGLKRLERGLREAGIDPSAFLWPVPGDPEPVPYRGLLALTEAQAGIFFGRDAPIVRGLDRLRRMATQGPPRLMVVLGASGAGKSSFLRAGLWPRLAREDRLFLPLPVVRPGRAAVSGEGGLVASLTAALAARKLAVSRHEVGLVVADDAPGLPQLVSLVGRLAQAATIPAMPGEAPAKPPVVVIGIDQAEELFHGDARPEAARLLAILRTLVASDAVPCQIVFTIRTDAYQPLQTAPALAGLRQEPFSLDPMPKGAYADIITGPARRLTASGRKLEIAPDLVDGLLTDMEAGGAGDQLPLLAFTLQRLHEAHGGKGAITLADYEESGRVAGAIEQAVAEALRACDADPRVPRDAKAREALMRRGLIPWLAGIDPATNAPRRHVARRAEVPVEALPLIDHLIDARLLTTGFDGATKEATIEPAHEALLRQWRLLDGWLAEDLGLLSALEGVKQATRDWLANERADGWLAHSAGRLEDAEKLFPREDLAAKLGRDERAYLAACRTAETARRDRELAAAQQIAEAERRTAKRTRLGLMVASVFAVAAVVAGVVAWGQWDEAERQRDEAERQRVKAQSQTVRAVENEREARRQAGLATERQKEAERQSQVATEERERAETAAADATWNETVALVGLSRAAAAEGQYADAVKLAVAAWPRVGDETRPALKRTFEAFGHSLFDMRETLRLRHDRAVLRAAWSPNGLGVVTASADYTARLWDAATGAPIGVPMRHESSVNSAAFSPDGTRVMTTSRDNTARLWDAATGAPLGAEMRHEGHVGSGAFSPDGARVVTASFDKTARLWDAATGAPIGVPMRHEGWVLSAAFSPDGTRVMTTSSDKTARLWDAATGAPQGTEMRHESDVWSGAFSPDGVRVVTASFDKTGRMWDAATGAPVGSPMRHEGVVSSAAFSPDGTRVVTASRDNTARLWDAATGAPLVSPMLHDRAVSSAAFSPDGARVLTKSDDNTVRLWDAATGAPLGPAMRHDSAITSAAFSPDGARVVTASQDNTARLWDAATSAPLGHTGRHVLTAFFSPDGTRLMATFSDKTARLWDAATGAPMGAEMRHEGHVWSGAFSPDGARVVTASVDKTARLWDAATGAPVGSPMHHEGVVSSSAFSPDGTRVVTASWDNTARLWNAATGAPVGSPMRHEGVVMSAAFSPDGARVLTRSEDNTVRLWIAATSDSFGEPMRHEVAVSSAVFSSDGARVLTTSMDNTARLWNAATGAPVGSPMRHEGEVMSAAFSPDGARVLTASKDNTARLWDAATGAPIGVPLRHLGTVMTAAFSPDGTRVVTASWDKTARLWDAATGAPFGVPMRHDGIVESAAFSPDGTRVVTASWDNTARLWDAATGAPMSAPMRHLGTVLTAAFSRDGTKVVTVPLGNTARIWDISHLEKGSAFEVACQRLGNNADLSDVIAKYGLRQLTPICGANAPLMPDLTNLQ
jgi:WD40 repeat protein